MANVLIDSITTSGGFAYTLSPEDKLWAARMISGEGGSPAAVLWTMAARFAMARGTSFATFIRSYSQPINPRWYRDGEFCREGGRFHGTDSCAETRLRKRERILAMTAADLRPELAQVEQWARGHVPNPVPKAVHFADASVSQNCLDNGDCTRLIAKLGGNWHMATRTSDRWAPDFVRVGGAGDGALDTGFGMMFIVGAVAAGAFALASRGGRTKTGLKGPPRGPADPYFDAGFWKESRKRAAASAKSSSIVATARLLSPADEKKLKAQQKLRARDEKFWEEARRAAGLRTKVAPSKKADEDDESHYVGARHHSTQWGRR